MLAEALENQRLFFWRGRNSMRTISDSACIGFDHFGWAFFDRRAAEENPYKNEAWDFSVLFLTRGHAWAPYICWVFLGDYVPNHADWSQAIARQGDARLGGASGFIFGCIMLPSMPASLFCGRKSGQAAKGLDLNYLHPGGGCLLGQWPVNFILYFVFTIGCGCGLWLALSLVGLTQIVGKTAQQHAERAL